MSSNRSISLVFVVGDEAITCFRILSVVPSSVSFAVGSRDSLLIEHRTRDRKVVSSNPDRSGGRIFFSSVTSVC